METGFHVEALLPRVAHRQWTLSRPFSVRRAVVKQPALLKRLEVWLVKAVWPSQRVKARRLGARGRLTGGGVCFWQWFGSRLQLTPHLHVLVPEAVWTSAGEVVEVPAPDDDEVLAILQRVLRRAAKHWPDDVTTWAEDEYQAMQHASRCCRQRRRQSLGHISRVFDDTTFHWCSGCHRPYRRPSLVPPPDVDIRPASDEGVEGPPQARAVITAENTVNREMRIP